jgi:hypothetical protein
MMLHYSPTFAMCLNPSHLLLLIPNESYRYGVHLGLTRLVRKDFDEIRQTLGRPRTENRHWFCMSIHVERGKCDLCKLRHVRILRVVTWSSISWLYLLDGILLRATYDG